MNKLIKLFEVLGYVSELELNGASSKESRRSGGKYMLLATLAKGRMVKSAINILLLPNLYLLAVLLAGKTLSGAGSLPFLFRLHVDVVGITVLFLAFFSIRDLWSLKRNKRLWQHCIQVLCFNLKRNDPKVLFAEDALKGEGCIFPAMPLHLRSAKR